MRTRVVLPAAAAACLGAAVMGSVVPLARTQSDASAVPQIEVASIKPSDMTAQNAGGVRSADNPQSAGIRALPGGQEFVGQRVTPRRLIEYTYKIMDSQLVGAPAWIDTDHYDFEIKAAEPIDRAAIPALFAAFLADRFQMKLHHEDKAMPVFDLSVDATGPRMTANTGPDRMNVSIQNVEPARPPTPPKWVGEHCSMQYLTWWISQQEGRPVLDHTGLSGYWDFTLQFAPEMPPKLPGGPDGASPPWFEGPSIFSALRDQLGLRLQARTAPAPVMVIDRLGRPAAN